MVDLPMRVLLPYLVVVVCASTLLAQERPELFGIRVAGGYGYTMHRAYFTDNADIFDCGQLSSGSGSNPLFRALVEFAADSGMGLGISVGYAGQSGVLSRENVYPTRDGVTGVEGTLNTDLQVDATLSYLEIQPCLILPLIGSSPHTLGLNLGPLIALPLTTRFVQRESVVSPSNATFVVDGMRVQERTINQGPLTTRSSMVVGASLNLESQLPVSKTIALVPAIGGYYYFGNVVNSASWSVAGIRAELGVRFSIREAAPPPPPVREQPPPPPPPVIAFAPPSIALTEARFNGEVVTGNQLLATTPVVNAVFFDSGSATIPDFYHQSSASASIPTDPIAAHAYILQHVSTVVRNNPNATIQLEGAGKGTLGSERAEVVKDALTRLGISPQRISVRSSDLPRIASNAEFAGGREENSRVDIVVLNAPLQQWVNAVQFATLRGTVTAQVAKYGGDPRVEEKEPIHVFVDGFGQSSADINTWPAPVKLPMEKSLTSVTDRVTLPLVAESGSAVARVPVVIDASELPQKSVELATENFEAVLRFDYNSAQLTTDVQQLLTQLVARVPKGSTITVAGSADVLGSAERNKVLENSRAQNTVEFIKKLAGNNITVVTTASDEHFSDVTPQGRFLNRSIRLRVTTK